MELGNMFFGNSRGTYPIERGAGYEGVWQRLCRKLKVDGYGYPEDGSPLKEEGVGYGNQHMWVMPYYWGECECGFEDEYCKWESANKHTYDCYRSKVERRMIGSGKFQVDKKWGGITNYNGVDYKEASDITDEARKFWCEKMGLPYPEGCAVHCTCDYNDRYNEFMESHDHKDDCPIVLPNFKHKESGFEIQWYKYPFRDSYMSHNLTVEQFEDMIDDIINKTLSNGNNL